MSAYARMGGSPGRQRVELPAWILRDPSYAALPARVQLLLRVIAGACDGAMADGSLVAAGGGQELVAAAGMSRATFWRGLRLLQRYGFVVTVQRGGTFGSVNYANRYGIPGQPQALAPVGTTLNRPAQLAGHASERSTQPTAEDITQIHRGAPHHETTPRLIVRLPPSHHETTPSHREAPSMVSKKDLITTDFSSTTDPSVSEDHKHDHNRNYDGASTKRTVQNGKSGGWRPRLGLQNSRRGQNGLGHLTCEDLRDTHRLWELFEVAVARRLITGRSEDSWLWWVTAAEHALRIAENPPAMFVAAMKDHGGERMLWVIPDEDAAARRIRRWREEGGEL